MELTKNNAQELTRYYISDCYEIDNKTGNDVMQKLYLGGNFYTAPAVYVKENSGAWQLYYIVRDYLGSITHIRNATGGTVAEYSYDAWGRMRNPVNQTPYAAGDDPALFLGRGYTGHEHLPWFGLINMNQRLYDPVVGRFLAPDPLVSNPEFSQDFNRYSYALNNPLKYVDLTGMYPYMYSTEMGCYTDMNGNPVSDEEVMDYIRGCDNRGKDRGDDGFGFGYNGYFGYGGNGGYGPGGGGFGRGYARGYGMAGEYGYWWEYSNLYYYSGDGGQTWTFNFAKSYVVWEPEKKNEDFNFFRRLKDHYDNGTGADFIINTSELHYLAKMGEVGKRKYIGDGVFEATINFYNSTWDLKYSFGQATIFYDTNGKLIDFNDFYDFDSKPWGERSVPNEIITRGYGMWSNGTSFNIYHNNFYK